MAAPGRLWTPLAILATVLAGCSGSPPDDHDEAAKVTHLTVDAYVDDYDCDGVREAVAAIAGKDDQDRPHPFRGHYHVELSREDVPPTAGGRVDAWDKDVAPGELQAGYYVVVMPSKDFSPGGTYRVAAAANLTRTGQQLHAEATFQFVSPFGAVAAARAC
jgi:hypothetical protein